MSNYETSKLKDIALGEASVQLLCAGSRISVQALTGHLEKMIAEETVPVRIAALKLALKDIVYGPSPSENGAEPLIAAFVPTVVGDKD